MTTSNKRFKKEWQYLGYVVDAEATMIEDAPKVYRITHVYDEDTFEGYS